MFEEENPLQHRITNDEFYDFLNVCREHTQKHLKYVDDEWFLIRYLELRGVILNPDIAHYEMNYTFKEASLMRSRDEIMKDAARYYTVYIERYATVIDPTLQNCVHRIQGYFNLSEKEVEAILLRLVKELQSERKYINEAAFGFQFVLRDFYYNLCIEMREKFGELLVKIKYNDIFKVADVIGKVTFQDALECNNVYALSIITLGSNLSFSDFSRHFSLYLVDVGLLTTLTAQLTETSYLVLFNEQTVSFFMERILRVVYNIALHSDSNTKQQFESTKQALITFPIGDNAFRELIIMLSLAYTMDEHELSLLSDERNVVETIIKYMQQALGRSDRMCLTNGCRMHLWELADGLSKLIIIKTNRSKIAHKEGALAALVHMLRHENVKGHTSAVRCIHALAQDSDVRLTLLEFPDLVVSMDALRKTASIKLRKEIDDALKTIRSCSPDSSIDSLDSIDVAKLSLIEETTKLYLDKARDGHLSPDMHQLARLQPYHPYRNPRTCPPVVQLIGSVNHVTNIFKQEEKFTARGKSEMLRPEDEQTIRRHWTLLIEEIDATHIIMEMISYGVFDVDDKREIVKHTSRKKRTETMLQKLLNAGSGSAFAKFIKVLELDHKHVVEELRK